MNISPLRQTFACLTLTAAIAGVAGCSGAQDPQSPSTQAPAPHVVSPSPSRPSAPASQPAPAVKPGATCAETRGWTTALDDGGLAMSRSAFYLARAGRHACYDRVVFDVNGSDKVGFVARYVPVVQADASGQPVPVPGRAALEVVIRAPIGDGSGDQGWKDMPRVGDPLISPSSVASFQSLRAVTFAGSFEGQTTVAVGVTQKRPFRVWSMRDADNQHVILDIAH
jgi:hypothetical protein